MAASRTADLAAEQPRLDPRDLRALDRQDRADAHPAEGREEADDHLDGAVAYQAAHQEVPMKAAAPSRRRVAAPASQTVNWVIKASKLCNLRCSYCYEWDELADRRRMSLAVWERMLHMIREYHERRTRESGRFQTCLIWHGGEPTVLPRAYFEEVMALQHRILGSQALQDESYYNALQTNLYRLPEDKLELFKRERFRLGVSFDVVGGVRVTADGRESEERVAANMDLLRERDIQVGA